MPQERTDTAAYLRMLRQQIPEAAEVLKADLPVDLAQWTHALDVKLLPKLQPDFPLIVAICGGGSAGKSTLFNSLIGRAVSPTGGRAGLNRRVLAAIPEGQKGNSALFDALTHGFGGPLQPLTQIDQLTAQGDPLFCIQNEQPPDLVLLDTPDIDTGARGDYANRASARQSLESADAFIYIFTNATYNNRDNTDFIARMLTGIGTRPCYLVYRVYASYEDAEVRDHALTVARNLYGSDYDRHILGIFRADDDNRVAAGQQPMRLHHLDRGHDLRQALAQLDVAALRRRLLASIMEDARAQAEAMRRTLSLERTHLDDYLRGLEGVQKRCVQQALSHFPTDQVLRRFADMWVATDPTHIKVMRRTGQVVEWPLKMVWSAVRKLGEAPKEKPVPTDESQVSRQLALDLLQAANRLYESTVAHQLQSNGSAIGAPAAVHEAQEALRLEDWQATLTHIQEQKEMLLSWSGQLETDLRQLADQLRGRMGLMDQVRQTFAAMLNVIPATAAVTYILHTGDPAGAVGIKVKLTGLLGLNDLYALIAIPATAGLKKADRTQMEQMLAPVARTWLAHKIEAVAALFERRITGTVLSAGRTAAQTADRLLADIDKALKMLG